MDTAANHGVPAFGVLVNDSATGVRPPDHMANRPGVVVQLVRGEVWLFV